MKIKSLSIFLILLVLPVISAAVEFDMKSNFSQDETFLARVSGNFFKPIVESDIEFFKNHVRTSIAPFVQEIENDFYIYAQLLGKEPNNYSMVIKGAKYYEGNQIIEDDLRQNFTIVENLSDFSIEPGFIFTNEDFSIEVQNQRNNQITINYKILNDSEIASSGGFFDYFFSSEETSQGESSINLKTGETKKIDFEIKDFDSFTIQKIQLSTENTIYQVPVYINAETEESIEDSTGNKIRFQPRELDISLPLNSKTTRVVRLFNLVEEDLEDLEITFSDSLKPYLSLPKESITSLNKNSSERVELIFTSLSEEDFIEGQIRAKTDDDFYSTMAVTLNFTENYQSLPGDDVTIQTCQELGGIICTLNQECQGSNEVTRDGICCLDSCIEVQESSTGKIIGWLIISFIIILLVWFYFKKYRGVRNPIDLLKIAKGKFKR